MFEKWKRMCVMEAEGVVGLWVTHKGARLPRTKSECNRI